MCGSLPERKTQLLPDTEPFRTHNLWAEATCWARDHTLWHITSPAGGLQWLSVAGSSVSETAPSLQDVRRMLHQFNDTRGMRVMGTAKILVERQKRKRFANYSWSHLVAIAELARFLLETRLRVRPAVLLRLYPPNDSAVQVNTTITTAHLYAMQSTESASRRCFSRGGHLGFWLSPRLSWLRASVRPLSAAKTPPVPSVLLPALRPEARV